MQAGLREVLHKYAYSNLRLDDVLATLQSVLGSNATLLSQEDAAAVQQTNLGAWLHDANYPLVTITEDGKPFSFCHQQRCNILLMKMICRRRSGAVASEVLFERTYFCMSGVPDPKYHVEVTRLRLLPLFSQALSLQTCRHCGPAVLVTQR